MQVENKDKILGTERFFMKFIKEFGIFILTVLNNFKSEVILNDLLDIIEKAIEKN